ncbi:hypothetical protein C1H76_6621 [Elsinoe australis]|uniref:Uncharacterized protein n=1 Tax=Elsinoe australis TaxID=40998 RepID=A0A4U7AWD5_9PEZI|nr:hypothetical protein C1H76_6621 [Elsinoe australis]
MSTRVSSDYFMSITNLQSHLNHAIRDWQNQSHLTKQFHITGTITRSDIEFYDQEPDFTVLMVQFHMTNGPGAVFTLSFKRVEPRSAFTINVHFSDGQSSTFWPLDRFLSQLYWIVYKSGYSVLYFPRIIPCDMTAWWKASGMSFKLLNMPLEVRRAIYLASFGYIIQPHSRHLEKRFDCKINSNFLLLSRQVTKEIKEVVFLKSTFYFEADSKLHRMFKTPQTSIMSIKRLELSFNHLDYMKLFGWELQDHRPRLTALFPNTNCIHQFLDRIDQQRPQWGKKDALKLREMHLDSLVLWMPHPDRMDADTARVSQGCQTTIIRRILGYAWPFIRGQPVTITGWIREEDKEEYETLTRKALKIRRRWEESREIVGLPPGNGDDGWDDDLDGGVPLDLSDSEDTPMDIDTTQIRRTIFEDPDTGATVFRKGRFRLRVKGGPEPMCAMVPSFLFTRHPQGCTCGTKCDKMDTWEALQSDLTTGIEQPTTSGRPPRINASGLAPAPFTLPRPAPQPVPQAPIQQVPQPMPQVPAQPVHQPVHAPAQPVLQPGPRTQPAFQPPPQPLPQPPRFFPPFPAPQPAQQAFPRLFQPGPQMMPLPAPPVRLPPWANRAPGPSNIPRSAPPGP